MILMEWPQGGKYAAALWRHERRESRHLISYWLGKRKRFAIVQSLCRAGSHGREGWREVR